MSAKIDIPEIIRRWLEENGYDGLSCSDGDDVCGCGIDNLFPCGALWEGINEECRAAYKHTKEKEGDT